LKQISARVISNSQLLSYPGARYFLMRIQAPEIAAKCTPGQFVMLKCGKDTVLRRPISVHSVIESTDVELLYALPDGSCDTNMKKVNGAGARWLSTLGTGARLDLIGPLGNGYTVEPSVNRLLLVAGGIGIAPLKFLAEYALARGHEVTFLLGARMQSGIFPPHMLPSKMTLVLATEDGSLGAKGRIVDLIPEHLEKADQVFACGPEAMYEAINKQMEIWPSKKPAQVSLEVRMGCGTGVCYSCSIRTAQGMKRVCKEGPVFNIKDIIWQEVRI
jgi:dihydroorotate dehydrogenase electron transfer subunit